jgi:hypothetical protein
MRGRLQEEKLRPYQINAARHLCALASSSRTLIDLSDTGTGKTYVASAVANALQEPTLVVVPKVAVTSWQRAAAHFGDSFSVIGYEKLRTGRTPFGWWDNTPPPGWEREEYYVCQCCQREVDFSNYDPCYCHPVGIHCLIVKKHKWEYGKFHFHPAVEFAIFDEVHRCCGVDSLNAKMLIAAKHDGKRVLAMSATAALSPLHMQALGYVAGLHTLNPNDGLGFYQWARRYGCVNDRAFGGFIWKQGKEKQLESMAEIGKRLVPRLGVCLRREEIPNFPKCTISAELYDLEENKTIDRLYEEMQEAVDNLDAKSERDLAPDSPLTKMLRAQQKLELLKVPIAVEIARDYQAKGHSVVIGVNFSQTLAEIKQRLGWTCFVDGSPNGTRFRQQHIDDFQANRQTGMVMNVKAGGVAISLHDLWGGHPRVGLAFPGTCARSLVQFFGRLPREGAKTPSLYRVLLVANSVETQIHKKLQSKLNNLDALNDADLLPDNLALKKVSL